MLSSQTGHPDDQGLPRTLSLPPVTLCGGTVSRQPLYAGVPCSSSSPPGDPDALRALKDHKHPLLIFSCCMQIQQTIWFVPFAFIRYFRSLAADPTCHRSVFNRAEKRSGGLPTNSVSLKHICLMTGSLYIKKNSEIQPFRCAGCTPPSP